MDNVKISIIVPVYNTGIYLNGCIESIINQTLTDWELFLIDDGSLDDSGKICDKFAERDNRITVIHKKNEGVSVARNTGLALAKGEYIGFVDSDDTIKPQMYERLYAEAKKSLAEIVMCDAVTVLGNNEERDTIAQLSDSCTIEKSCFTPSLLKEMAGSTWRCIYSNSLIQKYCVNFPVGLKFSEDRVFNIYMMGYANKVCYLKEAFYNRLMRDGSAVNSFHIDYFESVKYAKKSTELAIKDAWDDDIDYQTEYLSQFIFASISSINNFFNKSCSYNLKQKYNIVNDICNDEQLQDAISKKSCCGIRGRWIKNKKVLPLCISAIIWNIKNRR